MTIINITETKEGAVINETLDGIHISQEMPLRWMVECDAADIVTAFDEILAIAPVIGEPITIGSWLTCTDVSVSHQTGNLYMVTANYASIGDPTARAPEVSYDFEFSTEPIDHDIDDAPLANSSDEPLDPPLEEEIPDRVINYSFYSATYNASQADQFIGCINNAVWAGFTAKTVRLTKYSASSETIAGSIYYKISIALRVRYDTWQRRILDQGFRTKTALGSYNKILDDDGEPVADPVLLNGSGGKLTSGSPVFLTLDTKYTADFSLLPINTSYI